MKPVDAPLVPAGVAPVQAQAWRGPRAVPQPDWLAEEVPVALVFNGISHAVMLATPADLEDFALGFGITEGLLAGPHELLDLECAEWPDGMELQLHVTAAAEWRLKERRRSLAGRTGCGLCGTDSLLQVERALPPVRAMQVSAAALTEAQHALREHQALQQLTGATHAAAWCGLDGRVQLVREDIGRHNALDKLIGALLRRGVDPATGFACITSRASFEMVQKAAAAGIGVLAAVSAPTARAVRSAQRLNLALAGFVRGEAGVAYTYPDRLGLI